jgi:hypothetical protein
MTTKEFYESAKLGYMEGLDRHQSEVRAWRERNWLTSWISKEYPDAKVTPIIPMRGEALADFTEQELVELYGHAVADLRVECKHVPAIAAIMKSVAAELDRRGKGEILGTVGAE